MERLAGSATETGTRTLKDRFGALGFCPDSFGRLQSLAVSSLGMGTYLGDNDESTTHGVAEALRLALRSGFNLVDSSINYRDQLSERLVGRVLTELRGKHEFSRQEVVICTKGGFIPLDAEKPGPAREYISQEYLETGLVKEADLVEGVHCLAPAFLENQLNRSLANLNLQSVDVYYLHNPEVQLSEIPRVDFARRLRRGFEWAEQKVSEGRVQYYGVATWAGLRLNPEEKEYLNLEEMEGLAREVAGSSHHFKVVQAPCNLLMPEIVRKRNQTLDSKPGFTLAQACERHGMSLLVSAPLFQGQLARNLPQAVVRALPEFSEDCQRAIQAARSCPGVTSTLVGMGRRDHVALNLMVMKTPKMAFQAVESIFSAI